MDIEGLYEIYTGLLQRTNTDFVRYLYNEIDWNSRLITILGARGVGKTTMILQRIKLSEEEQTTLYVSADNTFFAGNSLYDLASQFVKNGGRRLCIDEIHRYGKWSQEVKMMYDYLPDLQIVITGSSILDIAKGIDADLSRRAMPYILEGLSFREFLNFKHKWSLPAYTLEEIIANKVHLPKELPHPLPDFKEYLRIGYYPFGQEDNFHVRLQGTVNQTLEVDIPHYANMSMSTIQKLKKLLYVISKSVPFKPNYSEIGRALETDRGSVADYIAYMAKSGLLRTLMVAEGGMAVIEKVEKLYLANTNIIYSLAEGEPDVGNMRETTFFSQMAVRNKVLASPVSDFQIGKYTFEVGGKSKQKKQIKDVPHSFVVKDDIETGFLNTIPLWAFGFNY